MKQATKLLLFLLMVTCSARSQTPISGTFKYPNGAVVSGTLAVKLERAGVRNTCSTPSTVVPTQVIIIKVLNGVAQGSPLLTPTDCLSSFQPYLVQLSDTNQRVLFTEHWYVAQPNGAFITPAIGNKVIWQEGLSLNANGNPMIYGMAINFGKVVSQMLATGNISGSATVNFTVKWIQSFGSSPYTAVCSALDAANPLSPNIYVSALTQTSNGTSVLVSVKNSSGSTQSGTILCRGRLN